MASASVRSPIISCQAVTGSWLETIVERRSWRSSRISRSSRRPAGWAADRDKPAAGIAAVEILLGHGLDDWSEIGISILLYPLLFRNEQFSLLKISRKYELPLRIHRQQYEMPLRIHYSYHEIEVRIIHLKHNTMVCILRL